ncbi:MAG TPA: universal stress protein, partial [Streptosporangiaceae bacterium]|nr:universal stress protein [Streptosporangiaceae bacterium]
MPAGRRSSRCGPGAAESCARPLPAAVKGVAGRLVMAGTVDGIVAGYDGSPGSQQALDWAAWEARARGLVLTVCHVQATESAEPGAAAAGPA